MKQTGQLALAKGGANTQGARRLHCGTMLNALPLLVVLELFHGNRPTNDSPTVLLQGDYGAGLDHDHSLSSTGDRGDFSFGMVMAHRVWRFSTLWCRTNAGPLISIATLRRFHPYWVLRSCGSSGRFKLCRRVGCHADQRRNRCHRSDGRGCIEIPWCSGYGLTIAYPLLNIAGSLAGVAWYVTAVFLKGESGGIFMAELWSLWVQPTCTVALSRPPCSAGSSQSLATGFRASGGCGRRQGGHDTVVHSVVAFITPIFRPRIVWNGDHDLDPRRPWTLRLVARDLALAIVRHGMPKDKFLQKPSRLASKACRSC